VGVRPLAWLSGERICPRLSAGRDRRPELRLKRTSYCCAVAVVQQRHVGKSPPVTAAKLRFVGSATSSLSSASFPRELHDLPILPGELSGQGQLRALIPVGPNSDREGTHSTDDRANEGQVLEEPTHRRRPSVHRRHAPLPRTADYHSDGEATSVPYLESCDEANIQDRTLEATEMHYLCRAKSSHSGDTYSPNNSPIDPTTSVRGL
jgi:hypothetical protein